MLCILSGCTTTKSTSQPSEITDIRAPGGVRYHTVKSGETLWRIARMYGSETETLIRTNGLVDNAAIEPGQVLAIPARISSSREEPLSKRTKARNRPEKRTIQNYTSRESFIWPLKGDIISSFGSIHDKTKNKGVDIRADEGREVVASKGGTVVFYDEKVKGLGKTVIIDHDDGFQTVYAYNSHIFVKTGDIVKQGQVISKVGRTGRAKEPCLHFEVRKNGEPRNPFYYLPH